MQLIISVPQTIIFSAWSSADGILQMMEQQNFLTLCVPSGLSSPPIENASIEDRVSQVFCTNPGGVCQVRLWSAKKY